MKIKRIAAIKRYFGVPDHPVTLKELTALSKEDRQELAVGAAKELGLELESGE